MRKFLRRYGPALFVLAGMAFAAWGVAAQYARLRHGYGQAVLAGATAPAAGQPTARALDAFHNAVALDFRNALGQGAVDVVFFNDSVMGGLTDDEPRTTIATLLAERLRWKITPVSGAGYTAVLFREYANLVALAAKKPRLAIVSINLRGFSDGWFFTPDYMYAATAAYLRLLARPPAWTDVPAWLASREKDPAVYWSEGLRDAAPGNYADLFSRLNRRRDALLAENPPGLTPEDRDRRRHFIENYLTLVSRDHPMLGFLTDTATRFLRSGTPVLFYVTPIDMADGTRLVGPAFAETVRANVATIRAALAEAGAPCRDMAALLPTALFVDREYACEHLNLAGREQVAATLAAALQEPDLAPRTAAPQDRK